MKLQILIPQYEETDQVVKHLLDSIAIQQNVNFDEVGVIICSDGGKVLLSKELLNSYPFDVECHICEHRGVSATRDACLDRATADYVMFCDADDMFYNVSALYAIFNEMKGEGFDAFVSAFVEESNPKLESMPKYCIRGQQGKIDVTFVHGKIYNRQYLIDNKIRWNDKLTIHEDSYFNCLAVNLADAKRVKFCNTPFYLWKWRDESVCRNDKKYLLKTYVNMLDSNTELVTEFLRRNRKEHALFFLTNMIFEAYFTLNKQEWLEKENAIYRLQTEIRFKKYYENFEQLYETVDDSTKLKIASSIKNRMFSEGLLFESITFDNWIEHIKNLEVQ